MVVAPSSTIDMALASGEDIPLEERDGRELLEVCGHRAGADVDAFNPVFDVTPADLIDVIVTEKGIVERPDAAKMTQLMCRKRLHGSIDRDARDRILNALLGPVSASQASGGEMAHIQ